MIPQSVTPAAVAFLGQYRESSYLPWRRISERIWQEEKGHLAFGVWAARLVIRWRGGARKIAVCRCEIYADGSGFFWTSGRREQESKNFERYFEMGLKLKTSKELQETYLEIVENRLCELGLEMPSNIEPDYEMRVGYQMEEQQAREPLATK